MAARHSIIWNIAGEALTVPYYGFVLDAGVGIPVNEPPEQAIALMGGSSSIRSLFNVAESPVAAPPYGGLRLPPLTGVDGAVLMERPIGTASWHRLHYSDIDPDFAISSFTASPGELEVGDTVAPVAFSASYNRPALHVMVDDGSGPQVVTLPGTLFALPGPYSKNTVNATQAFVLTADEGGPSAARATSIVWHPRVYWGVAVPPGTYGQAFIEGLGGQALAGSRQRTIPYNAIGTQKLYYCFPNSFGGAPSNFIDAGTGFAAGFSKVATVSVLNAFGVTILYAIWESDQAGLGSVNILVT